MTAVVNRAKVPTTTTGTGSVSLGATASSGFQTFGVAGVISGDVIDYLIEDGTAWELGSGKYTGGGTPFMSRDVVLASSAGGSLLTLSGTATVSVVPSAATISAIQSAVFGTGLDGYVTISSGVTVLTRDMHYQNLTISGTGQLQPMGFRVFVAGVLDLSAAPAGAISNTGLAANNASGTTPGAFSGYGSSNYLTWTAPGLRGMAGATGTVSGTPGQSQALGLQMGEAICLGGVGGPGGGGGQGSLATNGLPGSPAFVNGSGNYQVSTPLAMGRVGYVTGYTAFTGGWGQQNGAPISILSAGCGTGGGAGGGDGTNLGGGGGGTAAAPHAIEIFARILIRGASTAVGAISVTGRAGGTGGTPTTGNTGGGGGGGGAGGGHALLVFGTLIGASGTSMLDVSGGAGGNGGNGVGTGLGGAGGTGGRTGRYEMWNLSNNAYTTSGLAAVGTSGSTNGGTINGGAGGAGGIRRLSI